jgi:hypothetical protein
MKSLLHGYVSCFKTGEVSINVGSFSAPHRHSPKTS